MLRRLALRDFVIVPALELEFNAGFSVLTGETGAGKSILIDALQLALGSRGDAGVVREGAQRAEISAEFDSPASLADWLDQAGLAADGTLLLRRTIDAQGKSRAWINGSPATVAQLREAAEHLVDIHGQHAWQSLTRGATARALLDSQAGLNTTELAAHFVARKAAAEALDRARESVDEAGRERERLAWQLSELDRLAPGLSEWDELDAEQRRLAHAQALMGAARLALEAVAEAEINAEGLAAQALSRLQDVAAHDGRLKPVIEALQGAQAQLQDGARGLCSYLDRAELDPQRLAERDARLSAWIGLARRHRRPPADLPTLQSQWRDELSALQAATDSIALEQALLSADRQYRAEAQRVGDARRLAAPPLAAAVTQAMQNLGMAGGQFEVAVTSLAQPQAQGLEAVEFLVAAHAGSTPRPLAKVASGGELSRLALAIAVTTLRHVDGDGDGDGVGPAAGAGDGRGHGHGHGAGTLIFDEIDAGIGGAVGDSVGALMKRLGATRQVLAVTHLAQVACCADHHFVVAKTARDGAAASEVRLATSPARVVEIARMLGGERLGGTSLAHAQALLQESTAAPPPTRPRGQA